tara:strand:+ start:4 stop:1650 length:1647 start_codon:yes stop_codon:yes gene_type:complete
MRLNFQQQRAINPSAGPNLFVPESGQAIQNEQKLQLQLIKQQQDAFNDVAQAAVVIAKANQRLEKQEQQTVLDDIELNSYKAGKQFEAGTESNQPFQVDVKDESVSYELPTEQYYGKVGQNFREEVLVDRLIQKYSTDQYGPGFNKKVELKVRKALAPAFANAQRQSIENTKKGVEQALQTNNKATYTKLSSGDITYGQALIEIHESHEKYRDTFGVDIDKKKEDSKKELALQLVMQLSSGTAEQRKLLQAIIKVESGTRKDAKSLSGLNPLYWYQLNQQYGPQAEQFDKTDQFNVLSASMSNVDGDDLEKNITSYATITRNTQEDGYVDVSAKPNMKKLRKTFPDLTDPEIIQLVNSGASNLETILNRRAKSKDWDRYEPSFNSSISTYLRFHVDKYALDENDELVLTGTEKISDPRKDALYDSVRGNPGYLQATETLTHFDNLMDQTLRIRKSPIKSKSDIYRLEIEIEEIENFLEDKTIDNLMHQEAFKRLINKTKGELQTRKNNFDKEGAVAYSRKKQYKDMGLEEKAMHIIANPVVVEENGTN